MDEKLTDVTDNKVGKITDSEIVKAKELIKKLEEAYHDYYDTTKSMPYDIDATLRETAICLENSLNEINHLQTENERLNAGTDSLFNTLDYRLKQILKLEDNLKTAKAEAYKECIEKVKALFPSDNEPYQYWEIHEGADNILKELVGE